jgi:predicted nucleotidyltransferase
MSKIRNIDLESRGEISSQIEEYCQEIVRELNPRQIILFGSFATGDISEGSDIDIMVIADFQLSFLDRIKLLLELNRFDLPIEPIGYTAEEFDRMRQAGNRFISQVVEEGKVITGGDF